MTCLICKNKPKHLAETSKGVEVNLCNRCFQDLQTGDLTKGDLHIALKSKLH